MEEKEESENESKNDGLKNLTWWIETINDKTIAFSCIFLFFVLDRKQFARGRIWTCTGQYYGIGRRKRHFEVILFPGSTTTNHMLTMDYPPPPIMPFKVLCQITSIEYSHCNTFGSSVGVLIVKLVHQSWNDLFPFAYMHLLTASVCN